MTRVMETDSETKERLKVFNSKKKKMFVDEFSSIGHSGLSGLAGDP